MTIKCSKNPLPLSNIMISFWWTFYGHSCLCEEIGTFKEERDTVEIKQFVVSLFYISCRQTGISFSFLSLLFFLFLRHLPLYESNTRHFDDRFSGFIANMANYTGPVKAVKEEDERRSHLANVYLTGCWGTGGCGCERKSPEINYPENFIGLRGSI